MLRVRKGFRLHRPITCVQQQAFQNVASRSSFDFEQTQGGKEEPEVHSVLLMTDLKLLVKGSQDGLPLSDLQLSHLLLDGRQLSHQSQVLLPGIIQSPSMLSQHLHVNGDAASYHSNNHNESGSLVVSSLVS